MFKIIEKGKSDTIGFYLHSSNDEDKPSIGLYGFSRYIYIALPFNIIKPFKGEQVTFSCILSKLEGEKYISVGFDSIHNDYKSKSYISWILPWTAYHHIAEVSIKKPNLHIMLKDRHNDYNMVIATLSNFTTNSYKCGNDPKVDKSIINRLYTKFCRKPIKFYGRVQVEFSDETGKGVGTWKGGVIATSYSTQNIIKYEEMLAYVKEQLDKNFVVEEDEWY